MASAVWMEAGTDATYDLSMYTSTTNVVASASDQTYTGLRSVKCSTSNPAVTSSVNLNNVIADAGRRISFRFRADALPGATSTIVNWLTAATGGTQVARLSWLTDGRLQIAPIGATSATGTKVLAINTWYRITVAYTITNTTTFRFDVHVDGVLDASTSSGTMTTTGAIHLRFQAPSTLGTNVNCWFDDMYVDDGTDYLDPGNVRVTAKRPNANSTNTFDTTTATTNSGYGTGNSIYVNERPLVTTGARRHNNTTTATENFAIENAATGDVNLTGKTLVARMSWMHASGVSTDTLFDNNTSATPASGTVSAAGIYYKVSTSSTYPSNPATGMGRPTGNATDAILNECGVLIAYLAGARAVPPTFTMVGVQ